MHHVQVRLRTYLQRLGDRIAWCWSGITSLSHHYRAAWWTGGGAQFPGKGSTFWFTLPLEEQGGRDEIGRPLGPP